MLTLTEQPSEEMPLHIALIIYNPLPPSANTSGRQAFSLLQSVPGDETVITMSSALSVPLNSASSPRCLMTFVISSHETSLLSNTSSSLTSALRR